jgi:hypothetical protein
MMAKSGRPTEEQIRARAYQLYQARGFQPGHDTDDWLQAEYELMQLPIRKIAELRPPSRERKRASTPSLVSLVQATLLLGAETLSHMK